MRVSAIAGEPGYFGPDGYGKWHVRVNGFDVSGWRSADEARSEVVFYLFDQHQRPFPNADRSAPELVVIVGAVEVFHPAEWCNACDHPLRDHFGDPDFTGADRHCEIEGCACRKFEAVA